ncbi:DUF1304 domain-containing protein [bacterium]|nr:DUF1304 domain-containing protein [bacterium]
MRLIADILTAVVAIEHILFLWIEMFVWESLGKRVFKTIPDELFKPTKVFAANQGLYNGFLAAGLIWSFFISNSEWIFNIRLFFLCCVIVAGIFGAITASKKIFIVQSLPAIIALLFVILSS